MLQNTTREAVGVFNNLEDLDAAVSELEVSRFGRHNISVLSNSKKLEERFGQMAVDARRLEDHPDAPRAASIRPEERSIGAGAMVVVPAYIGGCFGALLVNPATSLVLLSAVALGSLIGGGLGGAALYAMNQKLHRRIRRQIRNGGLLVWVHTPGPKHEKTAIDILKKHGAHDVHIHEISCKVKSKHPHM